MIYIFHSLNGADSIVVYNVNFCEWPKHMQPMYIITKLK